MVEKKLQVCDVCEEKVAKFSCGICNNDLCTTCAKKYPIYPRITLPMEMIPMKMCKKCLTKTSNLFTDKRFVDQFIDSFSKLVQSSNILEELEEDE